MGLYDGHRDGVTPASTAEVAKATGTPVILVIDASHLAASAAAIALGFRQFDPEVQIAGIILNRWNPSRSKTAVERAMTRADVPILGYVPALPEITLPSRHLGLVMADEMHDEANAVLCTLGEHLTACVDLDRLLAVARAADPLPVRPQRKDERYTGLRVAVARDDAFAFYYPENIELLEDAGAQIVYFSPMADGTFPQVDGLYLGGGYPELHAECLTANVALRAGIAEAIRGGMPTYAECGGLLYLCESLTDIDGQQWPMVGAVPAHATMHRRLQGMGYRTGVLRRDSILGDADTACAAMNSTIRAVPAIRSVRHISWMARRKDMVPATCWLPISTCTLPAARRWCVYWLSCCQRYHNSLQGVPLLHESCNYRIGPRESFPGGQGTISSDY